VPVNPDPLPLNVVPTMVPTMLAPPYPVIAPDALNVVNDPGSKPDVNLDAVTTLFVVEFVGIPFSDTGLLADVAASENAAFNAAAVSTVFGANAVP